MDDFTHWWWVIKKGKNKWFEEINSTKNYAFWKKNFIDLWSRRHCCDFFVRGSKLWLLFLRSKAGISGLKQYRILVLFPYGYQIPKILGTKASVQSSTKVETNDCIPEQNQKADNIAGNATAQELYKCDICSFTAKHQQNLRVHKERFIVCTSYCSVYRSNTNLYESPPGI